MCEEESWSSVIVFTFTWSLCVDRRMSYIDDITLDGFWTYLNPVLLWGKEGEVQKASDMKMQIYLFFKGILLLIHKSRDSNL